MDTRRTARGEVTVEVATRVGLCGRSGTGIRYHALHAEQVVTSTDPRWRPGQWFAAWSICSNKVGRVRAALPLSRITCRKCLKAVGTK